MGRRPKQDPLIALIFGIITVICYIFKYFINFFIKNTQQDKELEIADVVMNDYKLEKIGTETANCPTCGVELSKFPLRKTKCKNCGNDIFIRTRPIDNKKVLFKESDLPLLEKEQKKRIDYYKNNLPQIDATNEAAMVIERLRKDYTRYCNYEEILRIPEEKRLEILEFVWDDWCYRVHDTEKRLYIKYPEYNREDLKFIAFKESFRVTEYVKILMYFNESLIDDMDENINTKLLQVFVDKYGAKDYLFRVCLAKDVFEVYDMWKGEYDEYYSYGFNGWVKLDPHIDLDYIYFWEQGAFVKYAYKDFKNLCQKNGYKL